MIGGGWVVGWGEGGAESTAAVPKGRQGGASSAAGLRDSTRRCCCPAALPAPGACLVKRPRVQRPVWAVRFADVLREGSLHNLRGRYIERGTPKPRVGCLKGAVPGGAGTPCNTARFTASWVAKCKRLGAGESAPRGMTSADGFQKRGQGLLGGLAVEQRGAHGDASTSKARPTSPGGTAGINMCVPRCSSNSPCPAC